MPALARLAALLTAAAAPAVSLAQEAGGRAVDEPSAGYSWIWILVGALVLVALFRLLIVRTRTSGRPHPPARHP